MAVMSAHCVLNKLSPTNKKNNDLFPSVKVVLSRTSSYYNRNPGYSPSCTMCCSTEKNDIYGAHSETGGTQRANLRTNLYSYYARQLRYFRICQRKRIRSGKIQALQLSVFIGIHISLIRLTFQPELV